MANTKQTSIRGDDQAPATKGDLKVLREEVNGWKQEIIRHFDVVIEDLKHDVLGAKNDEVEILKDKAQDHEKRIIRVEKVVGLAA